MNPLLSEVNLTPRLTALGSFTEAVPGVAEAGQAEQGQADAAAVVKDHVVLAASALPATSLTRGSVVPPLTVAVYMLEAARVAEGVNIAD